MPGLGLRWEVDGVPAGLRRLEHREVRVEGQPRPAEVPLRVQGLGTLDECSRSARECRDEEAVFGRDAVNDK
jgi:hypothetical protein